MRTVALSVVAWLLATAFTTLMVWATWAGCDPAVGQTMLDNTCPRRPATVALYALIPLAASLGLIVWAGYRARRGRQFARAAQIAVALAVLAGAVALILAATAPERGFDSALPSAPAVVLPAGTGSPSS
ncbi:MAG TPA: hypothetical protein PKB03_07275 [Baekduia sp.]|nr:hypothetical protein [Baekduia sp.]